MNHVSQNPGPGQAKRPLPHHMPLILGIILFLCSMLTYIFSYLCTYYLLNYVIILRYPSFSLSALTFFTMMFLISSILAVLISWLAIHFPMRPITRMIRAIDTLAEGDYSVRLPAESSFPPANRLAQEFNRLAEELGNTEMLRSDFINDFSHEFKTPIVSIRGFARILKSGSCTEEEREEYLDIILEESTRLSRLSENVLNLDKLEKQTFPMNNTCFNFAELIRRVLLMLEGKWGKKNLRLDIDLEEVEYLGDESLLSQLCINLLDNGIKFSPEEGILKIILKPSPEAGKTLLFTVEDQGPGMDDAVIRRIFDRFYQADSSHATEGYGLGLPVVKRILELYQGEITVKSAPGEGCAMTVSL